MSLIYQLSFFFLIYLAASGLSYGLRDLLCIMWDLSLQYEGSVVVAHRLSCPAAHRILVP